MSRVHDALRKAGQEKTDDVRPPSRKVVLPAETPEARSADSLPVVPSEPQTEGPVEQVEGPVERLASRSPERAHIAAAVSAATRRAPEPTEDLEMLEDFIRQARQVPFTPAQDALIIDPAKPKDAPSEEFRSLRTRLNHLQTMQPLHTLVISSASPGEGKSFTACNLALSQAQLAGKRVLLADFDFRRPSIERVFGLPEGPGVTDYLLGNAALSEVFVRIADTNLYILRAGSSVSNPLELLNLRTCRSLVEALRDHFDWVILDSPPLLFAADGNLLATMCDGAILVVRIGATTFDSVSRAMQSLCENNVIGTVVNGARRGELYSKYSYYHNYYYTGNQAAIEADHEALEDEPVGAPK